MGIVGVVAPLPLQTEACAVKIVVGDRERGRLGVLHLWLLPHCHRFADTVAVDVDAYEWPVVAPTGGLEVDDAPQCWCLLEVVELPLSIRCVHQGSLVRAVHFGTSLFQNHALLIWPED